MNSSILKVDHESGQQKFRDKDTFMYVCDSPEAHEHQLNLEVLENQRRLSDLALQALP